MKIAQIAPLYESVPPKLYGGTERVVSYLTEELVRLGHQVTLFAAGDSKTAARLIASAAKGLRLSNCRDPLALHFSQLHDIVEMAGQFDILHFHTDYLHFPATQRLNIPCVTTLHGRLDIPELKGVYRRYKSQRLVSVSRSQQNPLRRANWVGTVYHGIPHGLLTKGSGRGNYLAFIGRISPEKGVDRAIEIAVKSNRMLKIAAKVDDVDRSYFETEIKPLLDHPLIDFVGEINEDEKNQFLGNAQALLFPINWAEPFGLVLIEAMACGTPVIAYNRGSVPEIVEDNRTGYIVESIEAATQAVERISHLSRDTIRQCFEDRFTARRMAMDYLDLYASVIKNHRNAGVFPLTSFVSDNDQGDFTINDKK